MPADAETKTQLALCYANRTSYHKALNLLKGIPAAHRLRAYCYFKMKKYKYAIREFKNTYELNK